MSGPASFLSPKPEDDPQASLFSESDIPRNVLAGLRMREDEGEFTGDRFFAQHADLYAVCVKMLGAEMPVETIAKLLGVSDNTVRLVRSRESVAVADFHAKIGPRRRALIARCYDRLEETVASAEFRDVVIGLGVLHDKEALANGSPTHILGTAPLPAQDAFNAWAKEEGLTIDGAVTIHPPIGLAEGAPQQKGEASPPAAEPPPPLDPPGLSATEPPATDT